MRAAFLFAMATSTLVACSKPEPPQLTPKEVQLTALSTTGVTFAVKLAVTNPNGFALSANSFRAHAVFDGNLDAGSVDVATPFVLPAKATTDLEVPLTLNWQGLSQLAVRATQKPTMDYRVDGHVNIGGERLNVTLPYAVNGTLHQQQILEASAKGLQKGLQERFPGLPNLDGLLAPQ